MHYNLIVLLKKAGLTQKQVADAIGITPISLSHKIAGKKEFKESEMKHIQVEFFKTITLDYIFKTEQTN